MRNSNKSSKLTEAKVYGTTVLGSRGQLVIPAEARRDMNLKSGSRLLVVGRMNKILGLIKPNEISGLIKLILEQIESAQGPQASKMFKKKAEEFISKFAKENF